MLPPVHTEGAWCGCIGSVTGRKNLDGKNGYFVYEHRVCGAAFRLGCGVCSERLIGILPAVFTAASFSVNEYLIESRGHDISVNQKKVDQVANLQFIRVFQFLE